MLPEEGGEKRKEENWKKKKKVFKNVYCIQDLDFTL